MFGGEQDEEGKTPATQNGDKQKVHLLGPADRANPAHSGFLPLFKSLILFILSELVLNARLFLSFLPAWISSVGSHETKFGSDALFLSLFSRLILFLFFSFLFLSYTATGKLFSTN